MGIKVEFNSNLALRKFGTPGRLEEECLPKKLEHGETHSFFKKGQRNYYLEGEISLNETSGNKVIPFPLATVKILEVTHFLIEGELYTKGIYRIEKNL